MVAIKRRLRRYGVDLVIIEQADGSLAQAFAAYLAPLRNSEWVVYSKRPFGGPEEVLRYLARYTHRVAISNRRLVSLDDNGVTFKWKDYRLNGPERYGAMTLDKSEFIRRFLMHVLPQGFHRIRYYGLLYSPTRANNRSDVVYQAERCIAGDTEGQYRRVPAPGTMPRWRGSIGRRR